MNETVILGLGFILPGILPAVIPDKLAKLRLWQIKDAEPSAASATVTRLIWIVMILIGLCIAGNRSVF